MTGVRLAGSGVYTPVTMSPNSACVGFNFLEPDFGIIRGTEGLREAAAAPVTEDLRTPLSLAAKQEGRGRRSSTG